MLGLAVSSPVVAGAVFDWPKELLLFYTSMTLYFFFDWLTYNATVDARRNLPHIHLIGYVVAALILGSIIAMIGSTGTLISSLPQDDDTPSPYIAASDRLLAIEILIIIYLASTTLINEALFERSYLQEASGNKKDLRFDHYEAIIRCVAVAVLLLATVGRQWLTDAVPAEALVVLYGIAMITLAVFKAIRYDQVILPLTSHRSACAIESTTSPQ